MSTITIPMKTYCRENITERFPALNDCIIHKHKPALLKIVAGKNKEAHYIAVCESDDCTKISFDPQETIDAWNKWNPII